MIWRELLASAAILLTLVAFYPYLRGILRGTVRPHVFSWVIWASTTFVVFLAQLQAGAGAGAWPIGVSALVTALIAVLAAARRADLSITRSDRLFLAGALSALPLWYVTADPLWAVVVLTVVDLLGFGPTVRKVWVDPRSESPAFFGLFAARNIIAVLALESFSLATLLFPVAVAVACILVMLLILARRSGRDAR